MCVGVYLYVYIYIYIYIYKYIYIFNEPNMNKFEGHVFNNSTVKAIRHVLQSLYATAH